MNGKEFRAVSGQFLLALSSMGKSERTGKAYSLAFRKFESYIGDDEELTPLTFVKWRASLADKGIKTNSIRHYMVCLHSLFTWCLKMGILKECPLPSGEIPEEQQRTYDLLTLDEIKKLLYSDKAFTFLDQKKAIRTKAIVVLLLQSGIRNSELRELRLGDVDFEQNRLTVRHGKGNKKRIAPLPQRAKECIEEYLNSGIRPSWCGADDYLFGTDADESGHSTNGKVWSPYAITALSVIIRRYTKQMCGHSVKAHALRHAATSYWVELGVPIRKVQEALGHASIRTTEKVYTHVLNVSGAADDIVKAFDEAV